MRENTLFCYLVQHMKKKTQTLFLHGEKLVLEQSETLSRGKSCCSCLFTCLLERHPAVLGTLSVAQIKINSFSMTAALTEHIPCTGCAACLSPTPETPQQVSFTVCPGKWPLWLPNTTSFPPSPFCSRIPSYNQQTGWMAFPSPVNASRWALNEGNCAVWTHGVFMALNMSSAFSGAALLQKPAGARFELPWVMSLNLVDVSMHLCDQVDKHFLNPAKLHAFAFEMVRFSEML